jgi:AcrR family transcriptional regulator
MSNVKNNSASQETRRRLLLAAGEVFAERGFHAATIKEITDRAGASLASVNYHFRDKGELYAAVLRRIAQEKAHLIPPDEALSGNAATRFRQFIHWYCVKAIGQDRPPWEQILLAREMAQPTAALDLLLEAVFKPLNEKLSALIAELLNVPVADKSVALAAASVFGQCMYHLRHHHLIGRMHPQLGDHPSVEDLASHIAQFSLAGLRRVGRQSAKTGHRRPKHAHARHAVLK